MGKLAAWRDPRNHRAVRRLAPLSLPPLLALALAWTAGAQERPRTPIFQTERGGPRLRVAAVAETGVLPKSVEVSPDGAHVVVCNFGRPDSENVWVYDADTLERVGTVSFPGNAVESAFSEDGRTLFVSNFRRHVVEEIDFATLRVRRELEVGSHPKTIVVDGRTLYVANYFDHSVSVVDLDEGREVRRLTTGERPRGMGLLADGTLLTAAFSDDLIHVFAGGQERGRLEVCRYPRDILPSPDRHTFFVTCSLGHIGFYRPEDHGRPFGIASTGRNPRSIDVSADGRWIGVANFGSSDVSLIDTAQHTHRRHEVPGANRLVGLAMHPGPGLRVYTTSWDTGELFMLTGEIPE